MSLNFIKKRLALDTELIFDKGYAKAGKPAA